MKKQLEMLLVACALWGSATGISSAEPLKNMDEVGAAIASCWSPPPNSGDSFVTLRFAFRSNGTLISPPEPTAIHVEGGPQTRQDFVDAAIRALESCVPLEFSPRLAAGMGGEPFTMRFSGRAD